MNLSTLNAEQLQATTTNDKRVLVIAGAGTGKTKTITSRISYLIEETQINPQNILAMTFSNKAAKEMQERVAMSTNNKNVTIRTFHSFCVMLLRRYGHLTDRGNSFVIYDDEDKKKIITSIAKANNASTHIKDILQNISLYKQNMCQQNIVKQYDFDKIYEEYQKQMINSKAYDFDDLLLEAINLLKNNKNVQQKVTNQYQYILIDEYQDTNQTQFELLKLLVNENTYLMVVGDEDQSIYKFRGADINNILNFKNDFHNVTIIKLQQNYRSTNEILEIADEIISNNSLRLGKTLFTNVHGEKPVLLEYESDKNEANGIIETIFNDDLSINNTAIIYRTNAQARQIQATLLSKKINFVVYGSVALFDKEEIKDTLAIIKWLLNPNDKISFERFINKPARGIGEKKLEKFYTFATDNKYNLFEALMNIQNIEDKKISEILINVKNTFYEKNEQIKNQNLSSIIAEILHSLGLVEYYKSEEDGEERVANIKELLNYFSAENKNIQEIIDEISLEPTTKTHIEKSALKLMTVHNAKGLEFDNVFVYGLSENVFPHINAIQSNNDEEIEEERRLCYVAITRAKKRLYLTHAQNRFSFDGYKNYARSRFISEISPNNLTIKSEIENFQEEEFIKVGTMVRHKNYGSGKVVEITAKNGKHLITIDFFDYSYMQFILEFTKLEIIE